jgi:hypothetical protein
MNRTLAAFTVLAIVVSLPATATPASDEIRFRELFKKLVETNTTLSVGSCTLAAERKQARLKAAGLGEGNLRPFVAPGHTKEGPKREDWARDPFTLVEENGNFYARGVGDDKAPAAMWVDTLIRVQEMHYRPLRTVKVALTCGEETSGAPRHSRRRNRLVQLLAHWS